MTPTRPAENTLSRELLQHGEFVRRLACRLVGDPGAAEDVAQDALVLALQRGPQERSGLRAWLAGTVRRLARHRGRGEARRRRREAAAARPEAVAVAEPLEEQQRVVEAVLALEEPFRETVLLTHYHGLLPAEIARRQGVPAATVRTRLHRAHAKLRASLLAAHGGDRRTWLSALAPILAAERVTLPTALGVGLFSMPTTVLVGALVVVAGVGLWFLRDAGTGADPSPSVRPAVVDRAAAGSAAAETLVGSAAGANTTRRLVGDEPEDGFAERRAAFWEAVREARATMVRFEDASPEIAQDVSLRDTVHRLQVRGMTVTAKKGLRSVVEVLEIVTGTPIEVTPGAHAAIRERGQLVESAFHEPHSLAAILDLLVFLTHEKITWTVADGGVYVSTPEEAPSRYVEFPHSIVDLLLDPGEFFIPEDDIHPIFARPIRTDDLLTLIDRNVVANIWRDPVVGLDCGGGELTFSHRPEVHVELQAFLDRVRSFLLPLPEDGVPGRHQTLETVAEGRRVADFLRQTSTDELFALLPREVPLVEVLDRAAEAGRFDVVWAEGERGADHRLEIGETRLAAGLDGLRAQGLNWTLCHEFVVLWRGFDHRGIRATVLRDVRDLLTGETLDRADMLRHPVLARWYELNDEPFVLDEDCLDSIIRDTIDPDSWDHTTSNKMNLERGVLLLAQSPAVVAEVDEFLDCLRLLVR